MVSTFPADLLELLLILLSDTILNRAITVASKFAEQFIAILTVMWRLVRISKC